MHIEKIYPRMRNVKFRGVNLSDAKIIDLANIHETLTKIYHVFLSNDILSKDLRKVLIMHYGKEFTEAFENQAMVLAEPAKFAVQYSKDLHEDITLTDLLNGGHTVNCYQIGSGLPLWPMYHFNERQFIGPNVIFSQENLSYWVFKDPTYDGPYTRRIFYDLSRIHSTKESERGICWIERQKDNTLFIYPLDTALCRREKFDLQPSPFNGIVHRLMAMMTVYITNHILQNPFVTLTEVKSSLKSGRRNKIQYDSYIAHENIPVKIEEFFHRIIPNHIEESPDIIDVSGHWRNLTKQGKSVWVNPHTRKNSHKK